MVVNPQELVKAFSENPTLFKRGAETLKKVAKDEGYKILDSHEFSRVVLIGKDKRGMKIQKEEI